MYQLGNSLFDLDEITRIAAQYPSDPQTNPIGTYGVGVQSDAKHQAASARASDMFYDILKWNPIIPKVVRNTMADTLSFAGGTGVEGIGSLFDYVKSGFKDKNYLTAAKEDMASNWKGTFGTDYGTSTADIMNNVYKQNNYAPKSNLNIFNSNMEVEPTYRDTSRNSYLLDNVSPTVQPATPVTQPTAAPAAPVIPTYNPPQGPAGFTRPTRSPAQQAAVVDRKSKSMGVKSPIRRAPGTKYGFGL
jgi:hypothetical protein